MMSHSEHLQPIREFSLNQTMYETIKSANQQNLDFDAIGFMGHSIKYSQLLERADILAAAFKLQGIKKGDVVPVCTISTPEVAEILLALNKIGAISNWIDLRSTDDQLIKYINEHHSKLFIALFIMVPRIMHILEQTKLEKVLVIAPQGSEGTMPFDGERIIPYQKFIQINELLKYEDPVPFEKDRPVLIVQSSGTTGFAKSIIHTDYSVGSSIRGFAAGDYPFQAGYSVLVAIPPWLSFGLINSYYLALAFGMKAELSPDSGPIDAKHTLYNNLGRFDITFAAPFQYRYLAAAVDKSEGSEDGLKRIKCMFSGGDKVDDAELDHMEKVLGAPILNGYGCNEVLGGAVVNPYSKNRHGSVGLPLGDNLVRAFDITTYEPLPDHVQGEICIRTDTAFKEYVNNPSATGEVKQLHSDGMMWVHTGDMGFTDEDGYVYIVGRLKRAIARSACKIFPGTIEGVISLHPLIKECVVVGVEDVDEGHVPMAHVVVKDEFFDSLPEVEVQLRELCQKQLKDYECPKYFNFMKSIPYTSNSKQDFRALEEIGAKIVQNYMPDVT